MKILFIHVDGDKAQATVEDDTGITRVAAYDLNSRTKSLMGLLSKSYPDQDVKGYEVHGENLDILVLFTDGTHSTIKFAGDPEEYSPEQLLLLAARAAVMSDVGT